MIPPGPVPEDWHWHKNLAEIIDRAGRRQGGAEAAGIPNRGFSKADPVDRHIIGYKGEDVCYWRWRLGLPNAYGYGDGGGKDFVVYGRRVEIKTNKGIGGDLLVDDVKDRRLEADFIVLCETEAPRSPRTRIVGFIRRADYDRVKTFVPRGHYAGRVRVLVDDWWIPRHFLETVSKIGGLDDILDAARYAAALERGEVAI